MCSGVTFKIRASYTPNTRALDETWQQQQKLPADMYSAYPNLSSDFYGHTHGTQLRITQVVLDYGAQVGGSPSSVQHLPWTTQLAVTIFNATKTERSANAPPAEKGNRQRAQA